MKKVLFFGALFLSAAAMAQAPSRSASKSGSYDPNQTICRTIGETGSRLARSRVCMTRAQWDERRREARENVERGQINRRNDGGG